MTASGFRNNRHVVPRWRPFAKAVAGGELFMPNDLTQAKQRDLSPELKERLEAWRRNKNIITAAEVVESAIVHGMEYEALNPARLILDPDASATPLLRKQAYLVLQRTDKAEAEPVAIGGSLDLHAARARAYAFPDDPFSWADLALCLVIISKTVAAERAMRVALQLAPHDRQILRVAARLFLHLDDPERAHDLLKRNDATKSDPWLMAGEIALSFLAERKPSFLKSGTALLEGGNFQPLHMSELAAAIGTVHLRDGNRRARKLFTTSLIDPTGNSLAQAEWASPHLGQLVSPQKIFNVQDSGEARAFQAYWAGDFQRIIDECELWKNEEPYSSRPYMVGSMAAITLDNVDLALNYARTGLERDRDSIILKNHLAYALIARKEFKEASQILVQSLSKSPEDIFYGALLATSGMLAIRTGELEMGMKLYKTAIALFKKLGNLNSEAMASVYLALEAARAGVADTAKLIDEAERICKDLKFLPEAQVVLSRARYWQAAIGHRAGEPSAGQVRSE